MRQFTFNLIFGIFETGSWLAWNLLCSSGWPQTHSNSLASASQALGQQACATMSGFSFFSLRFWIQCGSTLQRMSHWDWPYFKCSEATRTGGYCAGYTLGSAGTEAPGGLVLRRSHPLGSVFIYFNLFTQHCGLNCVSPKIGWCPHHGASECDLTWEIGPL